MASYVRPILFAMVFGFVSVPSHAALVTWTLQDVTFDDGGTASGFVTFDPSVSDISGLSNTRYLSNFDIKTTAGTVFTAPFEYTPKNTDASEPYYVHFFSAPGSISPRHGLPQRWLDIHALNAFPATGGSVAILGDASDETFVGEDFSSSNRVRHRSITGGSLVGMVAPEPSALGFVAIGIALLGLSSGPYPRRFLASAHEDVEPARKGRDAIDETRVVSKISADGYAVAR